MNKILLVDDEKELILTLKERLETRNIDSEIVYNGEHALSFIEKNELNVVVLDLKMPGIDGLEVLRRIKRDHPFLQVIILTGHGSDADRELAEDLGAFAYFRKPVNINILTDTLRKAHGRSERAKSTGRISDISDL